MTQDNAPKEFRRGPEITVSMRLPADQLAVMQKWAALVPTMYFLDICAVNATKVSAVAMQNDKRKADYITHLQSLDEPQHCFSYLCALIEKVSDTRGSLTDAKLEEQVLIDLAAVRAFFKNAIVIEPDDFVIDYLRDLRRIPYELARPNYLKFLEIMNSQLELRDPVKPALKFQKATQILKEADALSISRHHPVVLITLACLYGHNSSKWLMKFKADSQKFNAENALADIMTIQRFASIKLEVEDMGRRGGRYKRLEYLTNDDGLAGVFRCFEAKAVTQEQKGDIFETRFEITINLKELLPDLANEMASDEFERIVSLLEQTPEGMSSVAEQG